MRAIWDCWQNGTKLDFRGDFYTHTLMTPFFNPGPNPYGAPKVFLAAVGEGMTKVAAEVADGLLVHGFTTENYLREVTLPDHRRRAGPDRSQPGRLPSLLPGVRRHRRHRRGAIEAADTGTRKQIAFYGSTPAYRPVLEVHGWGDLQTELNALSKQGRVGRDGPQIDDDVLDAFAVVGTPEEVPAQLKARFGDLVDRVSLYMPYGGGADVIPHHGRPAELIPPRGAAGTAGLLLRVRGPLVPGVAGLRRRRPTGRGPGRFPRPASSRLIRRLPR